MTSYFCPRCWNEFKEDFSVCPICGYDLKEFDEMPYEDKLIVALNHPVSEYRLNAIKLLGDLRSEKAVSEFEKMVEREDIVTVLEIIDALSKIRSEESLRLLKKLSESSSKIVSKKAKEVLEKLTH